MGLVLLLGSVASAQQTQTSEADRNAALALYQQGHFEEALPLVEQLTQVYPKDFALLEALGMCLVAHAATLSDPEAVRQTRIHARAMLLRAKNLGDNSNLLQAELEGIPEDGSFVPYSSRGDVDASMHSAEAAFARGDFAGALSGYADVLKLDPRNYDAALFSGDVYYKQKDYDNSYVWFAKAVAIDPDKETAYRYWGDALSAAGKNADAREKYIEAIIASPYQRIAWTGLLQWADRSKVRITQPRIDSPNVVTSGGNHVNITIDPSALGKTDGTEKWMLYSITRASWQQKLFQQQFPSEKEYRHSLAEESAALGIVAKTVSEEVQSKKVKLADLNPQIGTLIKLDADGLLESYILLGRPDAGIAQDYASYRKDHRDKLLQYMNEYVVPPSP
jgi:tetratricopeptide (TPR) repeat protein